MSSDRVPMVVAAGLTLIAVVGLMGLIWLVHDVEVDAATIALIAGPTGTAIGGLCSNMPSQVAAKRSPDPEPMPVAQHFAQPIMPGPVPEVEP